MFEKDSNDRLIESRKHLLNEIERSKPKQGGFEIDIGKTKFHLEKVEAEMQKRGMELNAGKIPASVQDLAAENQKSSRKSSP